MDNRKNTILLTVIAVATLLVAVVGATFAYFTAQGGGSDQTDVTVKTETSSNSSIVVQDSLTLTANQGNFGEGAAAHLTSTPAATGTITWTPSTGATLDDLNFCYTVGITVTSNNFVYPDASNLKDTGSTLTQYYNTPELLLNITKNSKPITGSTSGEVTSLTYETVDAALTGTRGEVSGWDLTGSTTSGTYNVTDGTDNIHQITGTAGNASTDNWSAQVTLVNKDIDQQYNTNKTFTASIIFTQVDCTSGDPIEP